MSTIGLFSINAQGLANVQTAIQTVSNNINNTQNTNYNKRTTNFESLDGLTTTVNVTRTTDVDLRGQVLDANSAVGMNDETQTLYQTMASMTGIDNDGTGVLQQKIETFTNAWSTFQTSPSSAAAESAVIDAGDDFASTVRDQFTQLNQQVAQEQNNTTQDVTALNSLLTQLGQLNQVAQSQQASTSGSDAANTTADQQDALIKQISQYVAINVYQRPDGSVGVYTKNGIPLVDKTVTQLAFDPTNDNIYQAGTAAPASFNGVGSFNAGFQSGQIGAEVLALDPTVPATAGTGPETAVFEKYREQLSALVDLFATGYSAAPPATQSAFDQAFDSVPADRTTDVTAGSLAAPLAPGQPTAPLTQGQGFFVTQHAPGTLDEASFAVNPALLNGTATVNRQASTPVINFLTASTQSLGIPNPVGGLSLSNTTPEGIASGIAANLAANQSTVDTQDTANTSKQQALQNSYSAIVGVNSDTELANLQVLQNQYATTGRLLSTADSLFQSLLNIQ